MSRFRLRIVLLSLGVVLGYGSAIARYYRAEQSGQSFFSCHHGDGAVRSRGEPPPKSVQ